LVVANQPRWAGLFTGSGLNTTRITKKQGQTNQRVKNDFLNEVGECDDP